MVTRVEIEWDEPQEPQWLCADNIQIALSSYCKNTNFKVTSINDELSGAEAIYGFCGWLTGRKKKTVMSAKHDCAPIAELIDVFCKENGLINPKDNWTDNLSHPKE